MDVQGSSTSRSVASTMAAIGASSAYHDMAMTIGHVIPSSSEVSRASPTFKAMKICSSSKCPNNIIGGTTTSLPFPAKLRAMLEAVETEGLTGIVSWQMGGTAFRVHQPNIFVRQVMWKWFNQTKYKSFQRVREDVAFISIRGHVVHLLICLFEAQTHHYSRTCCLSAILLLLLIATELVWI
jgi:hypothetical protein